MREQIAIEKLPLAQELSTMEEKLTQLRRGYEKVTRLVDSGNLEITTIEAEMKARQDELVYIGALLDEYAPHVRIQDQRQRTSVLRQSIVETARQAAENTTLPCRRNCTRQIALVKVSLKRLFDVSGGMRFSGVGVDLQGIVSEGQFAIIGSGGVVLRQNRRRGRPCHSQSGSTNPMIRPLEGRVARGHCRLSGEWRRNDAS